MRIILVVVGLLVASVAVASTPVVGQSVIYRADSTHSYSATVTFVEADGTCDLVILNAAGLGYSFGFGLTSRYDWPATYLGSVVEGSTDNRWSVNPSVGLVASTAAASLSLNGAAAQFDAKHDVQYSASVKIATSLTVSGGSAGHVDLVCDSSSTPTTVVATVSGETTGTLTAGLSMASSNTLVIDWRVPAANFCKLATTNDTGTPTYSVVRQFKQPLN